jgi:tetratricopeptide (TPR) repeat protein
MTGPDAGEARNTVSGGNQYGPVLQGRDFIGLTFVTREAATAPTALAQLPPLAAGFTGRDAELAQVAGLLDPAAGAGAVVVSAVAGLAGVGKTALAVHAAHAAREAGWFPGGMLFIDLHGYDNAPVQPGQALDALLRALGVAGEHIPDGAEQRAGLYRSALAQVSDPVLVIADNASAEAQVRPLLPGPGPHRVIITSRHTLAGLGARLLDVTVLGQEAAVRLLDTVILAARPDDDRVGGDPAAAETLAAACGGLPLALQITAALLVADPALSAAELAEQMSDGVRRLETLRYDDGGGVSAPSVAAAFELSYRQLDEDAARMFRLLPAGPGPDASTAAAAELVGWPGGRTRAALGRLMRAHLVEPSGVRDRWRMHDLLRLYARQVPDDSTGEREQASDRVLAWYLRYARAASQHLRALAGNQVPAEFTDRDDALAWLDAERPGLIAAVTAADAAGRHQEAMLLPLDLGEYLDRRRRFDDWLTVAAVSRDSAHQLNDKRSEAAALGALGNALIQVRRFEEAVSAHRDAVAIYRDTGDRHREGISLNNLGNALRYMRRFEEAVSAHRDAVGIFRDSGDRNHEGMALTNLGLALRYMRRFEEAITACQAAAGIYRETGDRHREGMALSNLGRALAEARRFEEAVAACQAAAGIFRETGDRHREGMAMENLGNALAEARRFEEAVAACQDAVAIFRETGDRYREGISLNNLANAYQEMQQPGRAASCWRDAAAAMRDVSEHEEATRLEQLGANARTQQRP